MIASLFGSQLLDEIITDRKTRFLAKAGIVTLNLTTGVVEKSLRRVYRPEKGSLVSDAEAAGNYLVVARKSNKPNSTTEKDFSASFGF